MTLEDVRLVLLLATEFVLLLFIVVYWRRPWRQTPPGRALMWVKIGGAVLIGSILLARAVDYPGEEIMPTLGIAFYCAVNGLLLRALITTGHAESTHRRHPRRLDL